jgi:hypothetical protein
MYYNIPFDESNTFVLIVEVTEPELLLDPIESSTAK